MNRAEKAALRQALCNHLNGYAAISRKIHVLSQAQAHQRLEALAYLRSIESLLLELERLLPLLYCDSVRDLERLRVATEVQRIIYAARHH